jgi:hypothetical protein
LNWTNKFKFSCWGLNYNTENFLLDINIVLSDSGYFSLYFRGTKIAYAAQKAWLLHDTLRDNILFGLPYTWRRWVSTSVFWWIRFMMFNATFNNISIISWQSVLLVEETGIPGEKHPPAASHWQNFITKCCIKYTCHEQDSNSQL